MKRFGTELKINLDFLKFNIDSLKKLCPSNSILFMVKADAYGHGATTIVDYAYNQCKISEFGVASLGEAIELRQKLPLMDFDLYVFSDLMLNDPALIATYNELRIIPVVASISDLKVFLSIELLKNVPLVLKLDTGMQRLGIKSDKIDEVIALLKQHNRKEIFHLMTHFANSFLTDEKSSKKTTKQYDSFKKSKLRLLQSGITIKYSSVSNSGAIDQGIGLEETHIRPGLMLYGPSSLREIQGQTSRWNGRNISSLKARIIKIVSVKKGDEIGYGSMLAPMDGSIILLALGYGDGFSCRFRNPIISDRGINAQILGRINMDTTMLIIDAPLDKIPFKAGDIYQIWGNNQDDIINLSHQTDTIPYEHFCQLTDRVPRIYTSNEI